MRLRIAVFAVAALLSVLARPGQFLSLGQGDPRHRGDLVDGGMLYLPRLFVYHAEVPVGSPQSETFKVMERRLLRAIINPAMIVDLGRSGSGSPGRALASRAAGCTPRSRWCLLMSGVHGYLSGAVRKFRRGSQRKTGAPLADRQRDPHIADDRYRDPGDREAVLGRLFAGSTPLLFAGRAATRLVFLSA